MSHKKQQRSKMQSGKVRTSSIGSSGQSTNQPNMGGREFGNVIEPMQAQMASGNEGLAESSSGQNRSKRHTKKAA